MTADPRRSLELLGPEIDALNRDILALSPAQWEQSCNCPGWQVADLVAHVVRNGWSMLAFVQRALAGDPTPPFGPAVAHIQEEIKAGGPRAAAERQQRETEEFLALVAGLSEPDLRKEGAHPAGLRPISWACSQRLAEAAIHHWDLRCSLGRHEPLPARLAGHLLSFLLDPAGPNIMTKPAGEPERFRLVSAGGPAWVVSAGAAGRTVDVTGGASAAVEVTAEAGWLALALYGRLPVTEPAFRVTGPPDAAQRFQAAFGG